MARRTLLDDLFLEAGQDDGMNLGVEGMVRGAAGVGGLLGVARHFRLRLGDPSPGFRSASKLRIVAAAAARSCGIDLDGDPEFGRVEFSWRKGEATGHDADHGAGVAVEADITAEDGSVAAEGPLPEAIRDHRGERSVGLHRPAG